LGSARPIGQKKVMGKLVPFEKRRGDRASGKPARSEGAEILIFTGVRYERDTTTPTKPTASSGTKRKRG
jgi:hypothetical protein